MKILRLNQKVTHYDVQEAVEQFLASGGIIVQLPEQKNQQHSMVGGEKYQDYESYTEFLPSS